MQLLLELQARWGVRGGGGEGRGLSLTPLTPVASR